MDIETLDRKNYERFAKRHENAPHKTFAYMATKYGLKRHSKAAIGHMCWLFGNFDPAIETKYAKGIVKAAKEYGVKASQQFNQYGMTLNAIRTLANTK